MIFNKINKMIDYLYYKSDTINNRLLRVFAKTLSLFVMFVFAAAGLVTLLVAFYAMFKTLVAINVLFAIGFFVFVGLFLIVYMTDRAFWRE